MKHLSVFVIILTFVNPSLGQRGYYSTDSTTYAGIKLMNLGRSNSFFCAVEKGDDLMKYTPFEVSEYGFYNGQVYVAFDVVINGKDGRYFLEQIVRGNISLYYLGLKEGMDNYYLLSGDSTDLQIVPLNKVSVHDMLSAFVDDCPTTAQNLRYLKPNKHSLKRYLNHLNSCSTYPYPKVQYGFKTGLAGTLLNPVDKGSTYAIPNYKPDISLTVGVFADVPLLSSNLSLAPEINFKRNHYSRSFYDSNESFDLIMNYSSLNFPLLVKYRFERGGNMPFIQFGPVYSRIVKNEVTLYEYEIIDNDIFIEINESPIIQGNMGGFSLGSGIILDSEKWYKWFGEVRYNYLLNLNSKEKNFNQGEFSINAGMLF